MLEWIEAKGRVSVAVVDGVHIVGVVQPATDFPLRDAYYIQNVDLWTTPEAAKEDFERYYEKMTEVKNQQALMTPRAFMNPMGEFGETMKTVLSNLGEMVETSRKVKERELKEWEAADLLEANLEPSPTPKNPEQTPPSA